jgi:hypothetical protein
MLWLDENSITVPGRHVETLLHAAGKTGAYLIMGATSVWNETIYCFSQENENWRLRRSIK